MGFATAAIPFLAKAAPAIGGLLGGLGSSGKQDQTKMSQESKETSDILNKIIEPDYWSQFRKSIMAPFSQQLYEAQKPVYGQAQQADVLGKYSALYNSGLKNLRSNAARYGRLYSGATDQAGENLALDKLRGETEFFSKLPFMESEAKQSRMNQLLGLGAGWAGAAPHDTQQTGSRNVTATGTNTQEGPSWWQNSLYGLGGMLMRGWNPFGIGGRSRREGPNQGSGEGWG